jgi:hypothetical protein
MSTPATSGTKRKQTIVRMDESLVEPIQRKSRRGELDQTEKEILDYHDTASSNLKLCFFKLAPKPINIRIGFNGAKEITIQLPEYQKITISYYNNSTKNVVHVNDYIFDMPSSYLTWPKVVNSWNYVKNLNTLTQKRTCSLNDMSFLIYAINLLLTDNMLFRIYKSMIPNDAMEVDLPDISLENLFCSLNVTSASSSIFEAQFIENTKDTKRPSKESRNVIETLKVSVAAKKKTADYSQKNGKKINTAIQMAIQELQEYCAGLEAEICKAFLKELDKLMKSSESQVEKKKAFLKIQKAYTSYLKIGEDLGSEIKVLSLGQDLLTLDELKEEFLAWASKESIPVPSVERILRYVFVEKIGPQFLFEQDFVIWDAFILRNTNMGGGGKRGGRGKQMDLFRAVELYCGKNKKI